MGYFEVDYYTRRTRQNLERLTCFILEYIPNPCYVVTHA